MDVETLTPDAEESAMRELGIETDAAQGREPVEAAETPRPQAPEPEPTPEPQPPETEQPEELQPAAETETKEGRPRDPVTGKFQKPDTEYSRAQKEEIRKARTWQNIQAEKEQHRQEVAQWQEQRRMEQLEAQRQQYQPLKKEGLTAQEYYQGAVRFEQEGDHENALKAYKVASELGRAEQGRYQQIQQVEAEYQWRKQMEEVSQAYPQIWQEPIAGHLQRIIAENGEWLYHIPGGFKRAAEVAHMLTQMNSLKEKDDEIIKLRAELEKYQRKSQPGKSGYASPRTDEKDFDSMDLNEMEAHLKGITSEADSLQMKVYKTSEKQRLAVAEHYQKNREAKLAYAQKYRAEHATELQAYRDEHREEKKVYNAAYQIANCEVLKVKSNRYFDEHPGYRSMSFKRWAGVNREKIRVRKRKYEKEKRQIEPAYRLQCNLRSRIQQALKSTKRHSNRTMKWTGCTIEFLKGWLESRWLPGMSWENYGVRGWHVDHIIPCDYFDFNNLEEAHQCFHYTNLRPLWALDNLKKSNFVGDGTKPKKTARSADRTATRESNLNSAAINPK